MAKPPEKDFIADWVLLQRRLFAHSTHFLQRMADLASQGSIEPREYIEESFKLWAGSLEEFGDWLNPTAPSTVPPYPIDVPKVFEMRSERGDIPFKVPSEVFDICGENATIQLFTDGLISVVDPKNKLRPTATLAPEQNVRIDPPEVTRRNRTTPELKVYGVSSGVAPGDRYRGVVWGASKAKPGVKFPVAVIEVRIA